MTYKTTKKDFELFKKESIKWAKHFGLHRYRIDFFHHVDDKQAGAQCSASIPDKICSLYLSKELPEKQTAMQIKMFAFHEVCELLLWDLRDYAVFGYSNYLVNERVHEVIRALENTVFKEHYK